MVPSLFDPLQFYCIYIHVFLINRLNSGTVKYSPCYTPRNKWMVEVYGRDVEGAGVEGRGRISRQVMRVSE